MTRTNIVKHFDLFFEINFNAVIRTSSIGQVLLSQPDVRKKALGYGKYAVGIFSLHEEDFFQFDLVGHAPVEFS